MLRETMGMTQDELAEAIGCKRPTIANAETMGYCIPKTVLAICMVATLKSEKNPKAALAMIATFPDRLLFKPAILHSNRLDLAVERSAIKMANALKDMRGVLDQEITRLEKLQQLSPEVSGAS